MTDAGEVAQELVVKLVRHGESRANVAEVSAQDFGDHRIGLTENGREQARRAGSGIGREFLDKALVYCSTYQRTRETLDNLLAAHDLTRQDLRFLYEDPRLREVEHGYTDVDAQQSRRDTHGWFYYRFEGGESPADCYDRVSSFIDSMFRQLERKRGEDVRQVLLVTHGLTIRCFVMRFLHLVPEEFDNMANPRNAAVITIRRRRADETAPPPFSNRRWVAEGLELRRKDG
jgi:broad specificity phosphatase PhoE